MQHQKITGPANDYFKKKMLNLFSFLFWQVGLVKCFDRSVGWITYTYSSSKSSLRAFEWQLRLWLDQLSVRHIPNNQTGHFTFPFSCNSFQFQLRRLFSGKKKQHWCFSSFFYWKNVVQLWLNSQFFSVHADTLVCSKAHSAFSSIQSMQIDFSLKLSSIKVVWHTGSFILNKWERLFAKML